MVVTLSALTAGNSKRFCLDVTWASIKGKYYKIMLDVKIAKPTHTKTLMTCDVIEQEDLLNFDCGFKITSVNFFIFY